MKTTFLRSLVTALLISLFSASIVLAHGEPTIAVAPGLPLPAGTSPSRVRTGKAA